MKVDIHNEPEIKTAKVCRTCRKRRASVCERPDAYARDVGNDPTATHIVCDECDYENRQDI